MAIIDDQTRELLCKVVFVGPPAAGVGTTFRELWALIPDAAEAAVIPKPGQPPIYELRYRPRPSVRKQGLTLVLHLVGYEAAPSGSTFLDLLQGADGVVLVLDSSPTTLGIDQRAIQDLEDSLGTQGRSYEQIAVLLQYNKRDLPEALSIRQLEERLNPRRWPYVATSAHRAQGLQDMLERLTTLMSKWVRVPAQTQPGSPPQKTPRPEPRQPATPAPARPGGPARPPTSSMVDAFARAEQRLFGRGQPSPGLGDDIEEERTQLAGSGPSPAEDGWDDDPTQVSREPSAQPGWTSASPGAAPGPLGRPLQADWSEDGPTQLDRSQDHARALGIPPAATAPASPPAAVPPPARPPREVARPGAAPPAPAAPDAEENSVAPWEGDASPSPPAASRGRGTAAAPPPTRQAPPAARPGAARVVHVPVAELTGHTIEAAGVAALKDMVTVSIPLTTSVGRDEHAVELRLELGGTPPPTKAPPPPAPGGRRGVAPLFVFTTALFGLAAIALLVLYLLK